MAGGFVWDIFAIEKKIVPAFENGVDGEMLKNIVANRIAENGGTFLILQFIFAVFAIFYFVIFGISHLNGKASYSEYKLLHDYFGRGGNDVMKRLLKISQGEI